MKKVCIIGLGWLGEPLGEFLLGKGYKVAGSTTSQEKIKLLNEKGLHCELLRVLEDTDTQQILKVIGDASVLVITIPPRRIPNIEEIYPAQIKKIAQSVSGNSTIKVVFTGSTSVYPSKNTIVKEEDIAPDKPSGVACLKAEQVLKSAFGERLTTIRFAGLIGYERSPERIGKKRPITKSLDAPLNLIHLDDCINIICEIIEKQKWGYTFNACADEHPTRRAFDGLGGEAAEVNQNEYKIVDNSFLKESLSFEFKYKNPLDVKKYNA